MSHPRRSALIAAALLLLAGLCLPTPPTPARAEDAPAQLVRDINAYLRQPLLSHAHAVIGDTLYFSVRTSEYGTALWRTDGSSAGTRMVADIKPGPDLSSSVRLIAVGSTVFVVDGYELWKSDGTTAGTVLVSDMTAESAAAIGWLGASASRLYFSLDDGVSGQELWTSDGTAGGTRRVADVRPGTTGSLPYGFVSIGDDVYFSADDGVSGRELWTSDGTTGGTRRVADIRPGPLSSDAEPLAAMGGTLYFSVVAGNGEELWRSDGTEAGTTRVAAATAPITGNPVVRNGTLFYANLADELWRSDGTESGTQLITQIAGGPGHIVNAGGTIMMTVREGASGSELWTSDGTASGTRRIADILPGPSGAIAGHLIAAGGLAFFLADDGVNGRELWRSDGTSAGTFRITQLGAGAAGAFPIEPSYPLIPVGSRVFFSANELLLATDWVSDGTVAGTKRIEPGVTVGSQLSAMVDHEGELYFTLADSVTGVISRWRSDGTAQGTVAAASEPGAGPFGLPVATLNGTHFFTTLLSESWQLWIGDGTTAGTQLVPNVELSEPGVVVAGASVYFTNIGTGGYELWKSDGTLSGTRKVTTVLPYTGPVGPFGARELEADGDTLYYKGWSEAHGIELWKTDGTPGGSVRITDINPAGGSSSPAELTAAGGALFFSADDGSGGRQLYRTDGTAAGTLQLTDLQPAQTADVASLINVGTEVFFVARDGAAGRELWKTDGTAAGTARVADIALGPASASPTALTAAEGWLLFSAFDAAHGFELWRSNGTAAGTTLVQDIVPGPIGSVPSQMTPAGERLFFAASTPETGTELWSASLADVIPTHGQRVTPAGGSLVSQDGSVTVIVPAGAVADDVLLRYEGTPPAHEPPASLSALRGFTLTARDLDGNSVTQFQLPITIEVTYTDEELADRGLSESTLNVVFWNGTEWVPLLPCAGCSVDAVANRVTVRLDHFTEFALLAGESHVFVPIVRR